MAYFSAEILYGESREWTKHVGRIIVHDLDEDITIQQGELLSFADYEAHWKREVQAVVLGKKSKACFLQRFCLAAKKNGKSICCFPMHHLHQNVYFQSMGCYRNHLKATWDIQHPEQMVDDRPLIGRKLGTCSEWMVPVSALEDWLKRE